MRVYLQGQFVEPVLCTHLLVAAATKGRSSQPDAAFRTERPGLLPSPGDATARAEALVLVAGKGSPVLEWRADTQA